MNLPPQTERVRVLLEEGRRLLAAGQAREAVDVFGRVLLIAPGEPAAEAGLGAARDAVAEQQRALAARLDQAEQAFLEQDHATARRLLDEVVRGGGDRDRALNLLDRVDRRSGRVHEARSAATASAEATVEAAVARRRWSRPAFATACTLTLGALAAGAAASWDDLMGRLTQAPLPRTTVVLPANSLAAASLGEQAVTRARRLLDEGRTASALALLESVTPEDPAYPFARQLRDHALAVPPAGGPPR